MSQENVKIVRRIYEAWATGDFRTTDRLDPHVVFVVQPDFPESGVFLGPEGVREFMERFLEQWDRLTISAEDVRPSGDTVLVRVRQQGIGRASGVAGEMTYFQLFSFRGPLIIRLET